MLKNNPVDAQDSLDINIQNLSEIIKHLEKNPHTMRESFFIELLIAFEEIDKTYKKRTIGINSRLVAVNKSLEQLQDIDKKIKNNVTNVLNDHLKLVIDDFDKKLEKLSEPNKQTNSELIQIGKAYISLHDRIEKKVDRLEQLAQSIANEKDKKIILPLPIAIGATFIITLLSSITTFYILSL